MASEVESRFTPEFPMNRVISPSRSELHELRQSLQKGEWRVFEFFHRLLPAEWDIYVQPHLNGLRPDFVLLHPKIGIAVFEIKDWDLDRLEYWVEERPDRAPILMGRRQDETFSLKDNPVEKVHLYEQEILELYCPRLDARAGKAVITAGLVFPSADDERVKNLLYRSRAYRRMLKYPDYYPVSGRNALAGGDVFGVFPEAKRPRSKFMTPEIAADLRAWLVEPDAAATQRTPLKLDDNQWNYATKRTTSGYRRIKGPAGSRKSIVLAARAADLVSQGKDVLVVTFNITLLNYIADLAVRNEPASRKSATWLNFHGWCKRVCQETDHEAEYRALWRREPHELAVTGDVNRDDLPNEALCKLVGGIIDNDTESLVRRYDAVLVDEGQDILPEWWSVLRKACKPGGEMMLVADATQDVYGTARSWTDDAMQGAGFSGPWAQLPVSYRLPTGLIDQARSFANTFLPVDLVELPNPIQTQLDVEPCHLRWVQTTLEEAAAVCEQEVYSLISTDAVSTLSMSDVTLLVGSQATGSEIVSRLEQKGIKCIDTFGSTRDSRRKKLAFFMGDPRVKATTMHSFKGWEARAIVLRVDRAENERDLALLYTGLTRLKRHNVGSYLTVVCSDPTLVQYGTSWPEFVDRRQSGTIQGAMHA